LSHENISESWGSRSSQLRSEHAAMLVLVMVRDVKDGSDDTLVPSMVKIVSNKHTGYDGTKRLHFCMK
jgi:hypothetical protein